MRCHIRQIVLVNAGAAANDNDKADRMKGSIFAAALIFMIHSSSGMADDAGRSRSLLAQNCGGYGGGAECPGAISGPAHQKPDTPPDTPADTSNKTKDDCGKGGYGVTGCPGYDSKSSSGKSTTDEEAAKKLQGCGGYGVAACPKSNQ